MRPDRIHKASESSDAHLMQRLAGGDMSALAALVQRHQDRVRSLAFRLVGKWDVADDIAQEAFLRLHRAAGRFRPSAALATWLHRVVVNLCLDWSKRRKPAPWPRLVEMPGTDPPSDEAMARQERTAAIQRAISALPERQRVALVLHRFEDLDHAAISDVTGWSRSAVESLLVRAYAELRNELAPWLKT